MATLGPDRYLFLTELGLQDLFLRPKEPPIKGGFLVDVYQVNFIVLHLLLSYNTRERGN